MYYQKHIFICTNQKEQGRTCCANRGGLPFFEHFKAQLNRSGLSGAQGIRISKSGCLGRCKEGPALVIYPEGIWYTYQTFADLDEIIEST